MPELPGAVLHFKCNKWFSGRLGHIVLKVCALFKSLHGTWIYSPGLSADRQRRHISAAGRSFETNAQHLLRPEQLIFRLL